MISSEIRKLVFHWTRCYSLNGHICTQNWWITHRKLNNHCYLHRLLIVILSDCSLLFLPTVHHYFIKIQLRKYFCKQMATANISTRGQNFNKKKTHKETDNRQTRELGESFSKSGSVPEEWVFSASHETPIVTSQVPIIRVGQ